MTYKIVSVGVFPHIQSWVSTTHHCSFYTSICWALWHDCNV